jgi:DNA-directed RNA polymerase specialized sigma subunit
MSMQNLEKFNFEETKRNVSNYFVGLENLEWEWAKLNAQKGLTANYDFEAEYSKQPYMRIGQDMFQISAKELTEEELKKHISNYYWAKSILSDTEQLYLMEYFINHKYEDEIVDLLGFNNSDSNEFKRLKKSAIYKFADFLSILVEKAKKN